MAVTVYRSTDSSAPTLSGTVGSLVALLDACLVNGYGSKTAAGWTKPFTATNGAVFRPGSGVQHYFHIDDNSPNATAAAREAQIRGSETASAFQTGTGFFPTTTQIALLSGLAIRKSASADGTARAWTVIADDRTCYLFVLTTDGAGVYLAITFGEFYSLLTTTDNFRSIVVGRATVNSALTTIDPLPSMQTVASSSGTGSGHYLARTYTGLGTSLTFAKWGDAARSMGATTLASATSTLPVPEPVTGGIHVAPVHINDGTGSGVGQVRGRVRGFFQLCHSQAGFTDQDTITGSGAYTGHTFLVIKLSGGSGAYCLDITGAWETN